MRKFEIDSSYHRRDVRTTPFRGDVARVHLTFDDRIIIQAGCSFRAIPASANSTIEEALKLASDILDRWDADNTFS